MIIDCKISELQPGDIASLSPRTYRSCTLRIVDVIMGLPRGGVRINWEASPGRLKSAIFPGDNPALRWSR